MENKATLDQEVEDRISCCQKVEEGRTENPDQSEKRIQEADRILLTQMEEAVVLSQSGCRSPWEEDNKDKGIRRRRTWSSQEDWRVGM